MLRKRSRNNERREGKKIGAVRIERIRADVDEKDGRASSREEKVRIQVHLQS